MADVLRKNKIKRKVIYYCTFSQIGSICHKYQLLETQYFGYYWGKCHNQSSKCAWVNVWRKNAKSTFVMFIKTCNLFTIAKKENRCQYFTDWLGDEGKNTVSYIIII
jgi:hypothetical protein